MSDKILTVEELQAKLEASSRINAELIEREAAVKQKLEKYEQAEAEAKAAAEKAKADAEFEAKVQEAVAKKLAALDTLGTVVPRTVEETVEETIEEVTVEDSKQPEYSDAVRNAAAKLRI